MLFRSYIRLKILTSQIYSCAVKRGVAVVINVGGGVKGRRGLWQIGEWEGENSEVGGRGNQ